MSCTLTKETIFETLKGHQEQLRNLGVERLGLFGSHVKESATADSDIDLLVDMRKDKKTFSNYMSLVYYLEGIFNCKEEVVTRQSLSPYIGPSILKTVEYVPFAN